MLIFLKFVVVFDGHITSYFECLIDTLGYPTLNCVSSIPYSN